MKNGSERTPEHPTGTDYKTLVRALRAAGPVDDFGLRQVAADAIEALQAENELGERGLRIAAHRIFELRQERDALQDRLDAIRKYVSRVPFPKPDKILAILDPVEVKEEDK